MSSAIRNNGKGVYSDRISQAPILQRAIPTVSFEIPTTTPLQIKEQWLCLTQVSDDHSNLSCNYPIHV